jgi:hypothetical protein
LGSALRCRNEAQTGRVTSDACLKIDECDSKAACDGSLQRLSSPAAVTNISTESKPSELFFHITPNRTLALAELNDVDLLSADAFLQAQCAEGYEGRLCHTCSAGWARSGKADCTSCDWPTWANGLCSTAIGLLLIAALAFMVRRSALPRLLRGL